MLSILFTNKSFQTWLSLPKQLTPAARSPEISHHFTHKSNKIIKSKMGHKRCQLCQVVQKNGEKGFFGFPSIKRKIAHGNWIKVCEIPADTDTKKMSVCFRHFEPSEIEEYPNYIRLKPGTILVEYLQFVIFFKSAKYFKDFVTFWLS